MKKESNHVGDEGCYYLVSSQWPNLKQINLCIMLTYQDENHIGEKGCKHLFQSQWPQLK
jgi:hypothetical protein